MTLRIRHAPHPPPTRISQHIYMHSDVSRYPSSLSVGSGRLRTDVQLLAGDVMCFCVERRINVQNESTYMLVIRC